MASAAAVAADEARSPLGNDLGEDGGRAGEITSGIYPNDEELPDVNGEVDSEDEELPSNPMRGHRSRRAVNGDADEEDDEEEGGGGAGDPLNLFGDDEDGDGEEGDRTAVRQLDDAELDSNDEANTRDELLEEAEEQEYVTQERITMDLEIPRQPIPEPSDGEMYVLKIPDFMSIEPHAWNHTTFQPPTTDHHSKAAPSATFSPYNTALTTLRWRHSPSNPTQLQSNARINRWADGSLTLQLASDPTTHYEIDANTLVPPQRNPIKPTPTSTNPPTGQKGGRHGAAAGLIDEKYDHRQDAYTYLFRPHEDSSTLIATHKITCGLSVKQSGSVEDDAIERLQASLAAAANASKVNGGAGGGGGSAGGLSVVQLIDEDPEMAKQQALAAVKEKEKAEKRRVAAIDREAARSGRGLGRTAGLGSSRYSGLNVGMLEDDEMGGEGETGARGRRSSPQGKSRGKQKPRMRRRNSEYSEDEDFGRKRFSREDEYDEEDDFVAPSDEEEVVEDDDEEEEAEFDDGRVEKGRSSPKRGREAARGEDDEEADAPGEEEEEQVQSSRTKRRRIVDDDEEEEEEAGGGN